MVFLMSIMNFGSILVSFSGEEVGHLQQRSGASTKVAESKSFLVLRGERDAARGWTVIMAGTKAKVLSLAEADSRDVAAAVFIAECAERPTTLRSDSDRSSQSSDFRPGLVGKQRMVGFDNLENSNLRLQAWLNMSDADRNAMCRPTFSELLASQRRRD